MSYICPVDNLPKVGDTVTKVSIRKTVVPTFPDGVPKYTGELLITYSNGYESVSSLNFRDVPIEPNDMEEFLNRAYNKKV